MTGPALRACRRTVRALLRERISGIEAPLGIQDDVCRLENALTFGSAFGGAIRPAYLEWSGLSAIDTIPCPELRAGLRRWWHCIVRDERRRGRPILETYTHAAAWAVGTVVQLLRGDTDEHEIETEE